MHKPFWAPWTEQTFFPVVVDAPCLSALFTVWDRGPIRKTACVQYVIRDCTKRLLRWCREEWKLEGNNAHVREKGIWRGFVLERLARRWILEGHAEKNVLHCLIKQRKELQKRHLQGWTDRAKVGSVIPSSILGVCGASLLRPNRANLPWMLRIPVTIAVVRTDFLGGFYSQWVKVYAQIWYLTADHECERQVGSITSSRYWSQWTERNILALSFLLSADMGQ